jgi:ABC-2 type transport system permease protein
MTSTSLQGVRGYQRFALSNTLTKSIWDRLLVAVLVGLGMGAMGLSMGPMFLALEDTIVEMMEQFPKDILAIAGGADMATPAGWYTGELYSIMVPFAVLWVAAASAARAFGGEIENRTIGVIMSTPVRRTRLAVDKVVAMVVHVLIAAGLIGLMVWIGIAATGLDV